MNISPIYTWVIEPSQNLEVFEDQKGTVCFKLSNSPTLIQMHQISGIAGTDLANPLKMYAKISIIREDNIFINDAISLNCIPTSGYNSNVSYDDPTIDSSEVFKRFTPFINYKDELVFVEFRENPYTCKFLFFKTQTGSTVTLENVSSSDTIAKISERILKKIEISEFRLIYSGKQLEDNRTIYDYKIRNNATIHCSSRLKGGEMPEISTKNYSQFENTFEQFDLCFNKNSFEIIDLDDDNTEKFSILKEFKKISYKPDDPLKKLCKFLSELGDIDTKNKMIKYQETQSQKFLKEITKLSLASCHLKELPQEINLLENLIELNLVNNKLEDLPPELSSLRQLRILRLEGNSFSRVPIVLREMKWLDQLFLDCNPLKELPDFLNESTLRSYPPDAYWVDS
jgi:hypothetical protein